MTERAPLTWLNAAAVETAMPPLAERLVLAERTLVALATPGAAELPAKIGIHPRPAGSFVHAMPAHLRDVALGSDAASDLVGMKWVAGFGTNTERGLPAISAIVVVNDPVTGVPTAILDGGPITAQRTAAVSGVALRRFGPRVGGRPPEAALVGAGVQGRAHLPVLGAVLPGLRLRIHDRDPDRAIALVGEAGMTDGIGSAETAASVEGAVRDADVVVTAATFTTPERRQSMAASWVGPGATVVAVDYATLVPAGLASRASLFLVDERGQFLANRAAGEFDGYPDPGATLGEAILAGTPRPEGQVVVTHLGVGLADLVFADAILHAARARGLGSDLQR
jgi:alanine dehydrogenase